MPYNIATDINFSIHLKAPYTDNYYYFEKMAITYEICKKNFVSTYC
jgi:hypothetical protein